jgi:hypothetical protein
MTISPRVYCWSETNSGQEFYFKIRSHPYPNNITIYLKLSSGLFYEPHCSSKIIAVGETYGKRKEYITTPRLKI